MRRTLPPGFNPDAWRVRREFERIAAPLPDPPFKDAEKAEAAVARVVKALGVPDADPAALRLAESWAEIVGEDVARRTAPGALERGVLTVSVRGSTWFAELRRSGPRLLLPKINAALGAAPDAPAVRSLRFVPAR